VHFGDLGRLTRPPAAAQFIGMIDRASWILAEPFAGLRAQALGLTDALGLAPTTIDLVARTAYAWMPAALWPEPLGAVNMNNPPRGLMFSVGGVGGAVGAALKRRGETVVQIQNPRMALTKFDLVIANTHDEITGENVIVARTALHRASPARLAAAKAEWMPRFAHLPRPLVAVLVGGSNGRMKLEAAEGTALARALNAMMRRDRIGMMVTPSRRTSPEVQGILRRALEPLGAYIWDQQGENPYFGMLACADMIVVTIDSVSMVSEAVATTAPVLLAELPGKSTRISLFLNMLLKSGRVRLFCGQVEYWPVQALDDTAMAASEVARRLGL